MKINFTLLILLFSFNHAFGQEKNIKTKYYHFEFGLSGVCLFEKQKELQKPDYFQMPNFVKFTWTPIKEFAFAADYQMLGSHYRLIGTDPKHNLNGYNRMHVFTASVGNNFHFMRKRFMFTPSLLISARPEGWEMIRERIPRTWPERDSILFDRFKYNGLGLGFGLSASVLIRKLLTVGIECRYNYFNEKSVATKEVAIASYRLNEHFVTGILKIGLRIGVED